MARKVRSKRIRRGSKKYLRYERMIIQLTTTMIKDLQAMVVKTLIPRIKVASANFKAIDQDETEYFEELIDQIEAQFLGRFSRPFIKQNLSRFFEDLGLEVDESLTRQIGREVITIAPSYKQREIINLATTNSLGKIRNLLQNTLGEIRGEVSQGLARGERWEEVAKRLEKPIRAGRKPGTKPSPFQNAYTRARLIARNEVGTALGELNKNQQETAGVRLYEWQTAEDERVRSTHRELGENGRNIYSWSGTVTVNGIKYTEAYDTGYNGGQKVIPGEAYNCRCVAIPFIPEIEEV